MAPAIRVIDMRGKLPVRPSSRPYSTRAVDGLFGGTAHYTAGSASATVEDVARYQTGPQAHIAFPEIAYSYFVDGQGNVHWCHDLAVRCWHSDGYLRNDQYIGVCYAGHYEPTEAQRDGLARAFRHAELLLGRHLEVLEGHRDASQTTCPGPTWKQWVPDVWARLAELRT